MCLAGWEQGAASHGVNLLAPEEASRGAVCRTTEEYGDSRLERCRAFMPE